MTIELASTDLLIAPPNMPDPRFRDSVIMITFVSDKGAHGLCVNKNSGFTLDQILDNSDIQLDQIPNMPVYWGGPVNQNSIWMLHSTDWVSDKTTAISSTWAMTSSSEMFYRINQGDYPQHFRLLIGYASWAPGQLDHELLGLGPWKREHSWLTAHNLGPEWLFEQDVETLWANVVTLSCHQAVDSWL